MWAWLEDKGVVDMDIDDIDTIFFSYEIYQVEYNNSITIPEVNINCAVI